MRCAYHGLSPDHQYRTSVAGAVRPVVTRLVAAAIVFMCSDDAGYITGEALNVSGGQIIV
jgi:NAD(P)-dependent dehydrogenase (short-subunit alcohol dehydrogenase family)